MVGRWRSIIRVFNNQERRVHQLAIVFMENQFQVLLNIVSTFVLVRTEVMRIGWLDILLHPTVCLLSILIYPITESIPFPSNYNYYNHILINLN